MRVHLAAALVLSAFLPLAAANWSWSGHGLLPPLPITDVDSADVACRRDSRILVDALRNRTLWAEQMWDASAKGAVGLLSGGTAQLGDFDGCLAVRRPVAARYCLATLRLAVPHPDPRRRTDADAESYPPDAPVWDKIRSEGSFAKQRLDQVRMGLCVPASCGAPDLQASLTRYVKNKGIVSEVTLQEGACSSPDDPEYNFTIGDTVFCLVVIAVILVVSSATIYDMNTYDYDIKSPPANYVQCLSAHRGFKSLFRTDQGIAELDLSTLYGFHVFAFVFIVMGHRYGAYMMTNVTNYEDVEYMFKNYLISIWFSHVDLFCDIFFFLSAFLLCVILSLQLDKGHVSPLMVYVHRFIRLVPAYAAVVFFYATLFFKIGSGPLWNEIVKKEQDQCKRYWWTNLLFISTSLGGDVLCLLQSWYISCDFQLFLVGTLVVFLLNRRPVTGLVVSAALFLASSAAVFLYTYSNDLPAQITYYKMTWLRIRELPLWSSVYTQSHFRAPGYLVGLLAGFTVFRKRDSRIPRAKTWLLLGAGFAICFLVYWSGALYTDPGRPYTRIESALYASTFHSAFAIGLALIVTGTVLGTKSFVSVMFSWRGFVPISKLSYSMYLTHNISQIAWAASARTLIKFDTYGLLSWTVADLSLCLCLSLVIFLYVETPCRYIFKHITTKAGVHSAKTSVEDVKSKGVKDVKNDDWSNRLTNS